MASVVTRAAVEAELMESEPAFAEYRRGGSIHLAKAPVLCDYARALGNAADTLAAEDPIPTPARSLQALREVAPPDDLPEGIAPFTDNRLLQFAAAVSKKAAVSSTLEIYPRGLDALRALRRTRHSLFAAGNLRLDDIQSRVRARYPEAAPLPPRPKIDELIREVRPDLLWNEEKQSYISSARDSLTINTSGRTHTADAAPRSERVFVPDEPKARALQRRLRRADKEGAFLALSAARKFYSDAEAALLARFNVERCDLDAIFLNAMHAEAEKRGMKWDVVLRADAAAPDSPEWRKLMIFLDHCLPAVEAELARPHLRTRLLVHAGLLARYDRIPLLARIIQRVGQPNGPHGLWLLLPADGLSPLPMIQGAAVPVITSNEHAELTEDWVACLAEQQVSHFSAFFDSPDSLRVKSKRLNAPVPFSWTPLGRSSWSVKFPPRRFANSRRFRVSQQRDTEYTGRGLRGGGFAAAGNIQDAETWREEPCHVQDRTLREIGCGRLSHRLVSP